MIKKSAHVKKPYGKSAIHGIPHPNAHREGSSACQIHQCWLEVEVPNSKTTLTGTRVFDWHMVKCGSKNG